MVHKFFGQMEPIPGFEGVYWITKSGYVCNKYGNTLKETESVNGPQVELRKLGQRERFYISELIERTYGGNSSAGN